MAWIVEYTQRFEAWWGTLGPDEQNSVAVSVGLLTVQGPALGFPHTSTIETSRHGHMRELRIQHRGRPYRVLYAFDRRRVAVLLLGGKKQGGQRWYRRMVPLADRLYDEHVRKLAGEGSTDG